MKKRLFRLVLALLLGLLLVIAGGPYWVAAVGIPQQLRVFPGMELSLDIRPPFRLFDQEGVEITGLFNTEELGSSTYRLNLFGWLPLSEVVVDVVPLIQVFPGGQSIGVLLSSDGLVVSQVGGVLGLDGEEYFPARDGGIEAGDILLSVEGHPLHRAEQVSQLINGLAVKKKKLKFVVRRGNRILTCEITPIRALRTDLFGRNTTDYLLGIYLEDPAAGVGTMSFYDPNSGRFGALGHAITDSLSRPIRIVSGSIVEASIDSVRVGARGSPGEKVGFFHGEQDVLGSIDSNSGFGIFGQLRQSFRHPFFPEPVPVAFAHQVREGAAEIYTVISGSSIERFTVNIIRVNNQSKPSDKGIIIQVTDERLLKATGGIIQGMSGSPILQGGMLVGAVTHVFVNDPTKGYGSFAEWMVYEAGLKEELPAKQSFSWEGFFLTIEKDFSSPA
ncbi:MAG TPA: SpoIVB peptidase [Firmicutes bacterium]|nr:SpoIVB peptidase [Bacillota bacterium]